MEALAAALAPACAFRPRRRLGRGVPGLGALRRNQATACARTAQRQSEAMALAAYRLEETSLHGRNFAPRTPCRLAREFEAAAGFTRRYSRSGCAGGKSKSRNGRSRPGARAVEREYPSRTRRAHANLPPLDAGKDQHLEHLEAYSAARRAAGSRLAGALASHRARRAVAAAGSGAHFGANF